MLASVLRAELGIDALRRLPHDFRGPLPFSLTPLAARDPVRRPSAELGLPKGERVPRSVLELAAAYRARKATPERVTARVLEAARDLASQVPTLGPLCGYDDERALDAARASTERFARGTPLGLLDGVPIGVKEEIDLCGFPTRMGTGYSGFRPSERDAPVVARLRAAGAVIVGQTPMTELGLSPLGANPHRRMPTNPHDPMRLAGGSSTGSAVAVALGLTPLSIGSDAGGSIRIPAAYTGVFGLKPTYGRIPLEGVGLASAASMLHIGPLGTSSTDLALFLEAAAGPDPRDPASLDARPFEPGELRAAVGRGVAGLRIGIDVEEWASAPDPLSRPGRDALEALERAGARLVEVHSRLARYAGPIGYLTVGIEGYVSLAAIRERHMDELGLDLQLVLSGLETFRPDDYVDAQRLRSALRRETADILRGVDVIALPAVGRSPLSVSQDESRSGFIDPTALDATCRFAFLANLTGLPAASVPVGSDSEGMPVALQLLGDAWDEALVLSVAAHLERLGIAEPPRAPAAIDLL